MNQSKEYNDTLKELRKAKKGVATPSSYIDELCRKLDKLEKI